MSMLHDVDWGSVPSWLGGISIILAFAVFRRDRTKIDRQQIEQLGVWIEPKHSTDPPLPDRARINICIRNASNLPLYVDTIEISYKTRWRIPVKDRTDVWASALGGDKGHSPYCENHGLVKPGETTETPADLWLLDRAPEGATALDWLTVVINRIDASDNAGRKWSIRPRSRNAIRRIRFYHLVIKPPMLFHPWYRTRYSLVYYALRHPRRAARWLLASYKERSRPFVHAEEYLQFQKELERVHKAADAAAATEHKDDSPDDAEAS